MFTEFDIPISERIQKLKAKRECINKDMRLNFERNRIITDYYRNHENEYPVLKRAAFYEWCATRKINIDDDDIFLGDGGPQCRTVHFDIEQTSQSWFRSCLRRHRRAFRAAWQVPGSVWVDDEDREWILRPQITGKTKI